LADQKVHSRADSSAVLMVDEKVALWVLQMAAQKAFLSVASRAAL